MALQDRFRQCMAGGVTAIVAIPQCVALGVSAFAPFHGAYPALAQVAGFYSAIIAGLFVALGGRGQMSLSGPRIGATIVISGSLASFLDPAAQFGVGNEAALGLILVVMMLAGLIQWILGLLGYASLHHYLPKPVIVGLLSGVAVAMLAKQGVNLATRGVGFAAIAAPTFLLALALWALRKSRFTFRGKEPLTRFGMLIATAFGIGLYFLLSPQLASAGGTLGAIDQLWPWPEIGVGFSAAAKAVIDRPDLLPNLISAAFMLAVVASIDTTTAYVNTRRKLGGKLIPELQDDASRRDDENNELVWHGLGNLLAPLIGGITSSASDARAAAAVDAGGRTWITGLAYAAALAILVVTARAYPWTSLFPLAVVSGLMLQIATILLADQWDDLRRYGHAIHRTAGEWLRGSGTTNAQGIIGLRSRFAETALNGIAVVLVGSAVVFFDPLVAVAIGTSSSMLLFVFKISHAQRHRHYVASTRPSLESRPKPLAHLADQARSNCHVIKLHGDFFFLSRKNTHALISEIADFRRKQSVQTAGYAVIDFDMTHEFDESGVGEIRMLIERLIELDLTVLMSYLPPDGALRRLLGEARVLRCEFDPPLKRGQSYLVDETHVFENTERAINYVEDEYLRNHDPVPSRKTTVPAALQTLAHSRARPADVLKGTLEQVRFWFVASGKVTLRLKASQSVAAAEWSKVVAELGPQAIFASRALTLPGISVEASPCARLVAIESHWIESLKRTAPDQAAEVLDHLLAHLADANAMLQLEAAMIDH